MGCERVLDASVAGVLAGKRDGVVDRCGNDGNDSCWWSSLVRNKRKTLTKISALLNHMKPSIQRSELPTTNTYRNICTDGPVWCFVNLKTITVLLECEYVYKVLHLDCNSCTTS